eukprot:201187_1
MATTFPRIDAHLLHAQCKYGLIVAHPVSPEECKTYWKKLKLYKHGIKSKNYKPSYIYNVVCAHPICQNGWSSRVNSRSFKDNHWKKQHPTDHDIQLRVVSYWTVAKEKKMIDGCMTEFTQCITEYRLVSRNSLNYINPCDEVHINMANVTANDSTLDGTDMYTHVVAISATEDNDNVNINYHRQVMDIAHDQNHNDHASPPHITITNEPNSQKRQYNEYIDTDSKSESIPSLKKRKFANTHHESAHNESNCCGLFEYKYSTIKYMITWHHLFGINYSFLNLNKLSTPGDPTTYFFCNGLQPRISIMSRKCVSCKNLCTESFTEAYNLFDNRFVHVVCDFLESSKSKGWKHFNIFSPRDGNTIFMLELSCDYRSFKWILCETGMKRYDDLSAKPSWSSKPGTRITLNYLNNTFSKYLMPRRKICKGAGDESWFTEHEFGSTHLSVKWLNGTYIHKECALFIGGKNLRCEKCKYTHKNITTLKKRAKHCKLPSKHTANKYLTNTQRAKKINSLQTQLKTEQKLRSKCEQELNKLKQTYSIAFIEEDIVVNSNYGKMVKFLLTNYESIKGGLQGKELSDTKICFMHDQLKYAKRTFDDWLNGDVCAKKKGIRWSAEMLSFATEMLSMGSGHYKKMQSAKAFFMPSHGHIKHKVLQGRHTDMTSVDIIHELRDRLIECYGSIQAAINDTFDLSWDEITIDDGMHINVSNFAADGRPSYLQSDNTLECVRHVLFNVNYDKVDDMAGSKYILQLVIRGTTSSFVWYGPHFGSLSGLSAMNILGHVEDDFLLAAKLCLDFEISAIHFDLCGHHQQYFLYRTEKRTLKALIGRPILIDIEFYTRNRQVVLVPDKDHSIKALRNYIYNHPNKWTDWYSLKRARELDLQSTDPVLELETTTLYLDRFNKMNMKYIY